MRFFASLSLENVFPKNHARTVIGFKTLNIFFSFFSQRVDRKELEVTSLYIIARARNDDDDDD